jgi:hypothetical protein
MPAAGKLLEMLASKTGSVQGAEPISALVQLQ